MKSSGFWKESAGSALATAIRIVSAFITNKFLASVMGPAGFAAVGQLQNLITFGQGTSSLALQNGWVSLTARYKEKEKELGPIWRGGFRLSVYASLATAIFFVLFAFFAPLEALFPGVPKRLLQAAILFAIPGMIALSVTTICQSVMNGLSDYKRWASITIVSSILNCAWVIGMVQTRSLSVLSAVATQSLLSCGFAIWNAKKGGFRYKRFSAKLNANSKVWRGYALMGLVPMVLTPLLYMFVRSFLAKQFGWDAAGLWQGAVRISDFFNVGFSSVLGVVMLPRLSAAVASDEFHRTLRSLLVRVLALAALAVGILFLFREYVVVIALSKTFLPLKELIPMQFLGDFFKAGCWCLGLALVARKETAAFLCVEIGADVLFAGLTVIGASFFGYYSPFVAYAVENVICFGALLILVRRLSWKNL
ncbi:MAG: O-antigen translocase [Fibrobacter sp.]|nr:O-antigen translocase [Fibrobacter sp.]